MTHSDDANIWVVGLTTAIGMSLLAATLGMICGSLGSVLFILWRFG